MCVLIHSNHPKPERTFKFYEVEKGHQLGHHSSHTDGSSILQLYWWPQRTLFILSSIYEHLSLSAQSAVITILPLLQGSSDPPQRT